jgi:hypothetical protein
MSGQRFMIDNSRPVLVEASLMCLIRGWVDSFAMVSSERSLRWNCGLVYSTTGMSTASAMARK